MFLYIVEGICMLSVAGIVYVFVRTYPRARDQMSGDELVARGRVDWNAIYRVDTKLLTVFEKLLRKMRVIILKTDHVVSQKIDRVKKKSGERDTNESHVLIALEKQQEGDADTEDHHGTGKSSTK